MILIADCGSTKIDWCLLDGTDTVKRFNTVGINAVMLTEEEIRERLLAELAQELDGMRPESVYFYGAGCISDEVCGNVSRAIDAAIGPCAHIEVHSDLLAAARALCGHYPGIACIMGTGSNSCLYDGAEITDNVSPLGFILGDEGSGAVLGKLFLGDVLKNQIEASLRDAFLSEYGLDRLAVIRRVYREPAANRFLASVTPFLSAHIDHPQVHRLVLGSFRAFFRRNVCQYPGHTELPVNFIGSIAHYFEGVLREAADQCGCRVGTILRSPMEGLVAFHTGGSPR